ncbi:hypothetical protein LCGC14_1950210, partial [marine sediment metagenome]
VQDIFYSLFGSDIRWAVLEYVQELEAHD